ncbi:MAG: GNAT family N-acetyltransferase, partial [Gemmatimonadetes bacterium]|nr:GNAT family N-acetyltransferase [Gemmatimonadota bacterium]
MSSPPPNPAHVYICPDPKTRFAQLEWVLGGNLRVHVEADPAVSFCLRGDSLDAIGYWTRPDAAEIGLLPKIRAGFLAAPFRFGWSGFRRLLEVDTAVNRHYREALGDESFWYLSNMVVREKLRGTGVGTQLLREQLRIVMEQDPRAAVALATQREGNVAFYRRLGFEIEVQRHAMLIRKLIQIFRHRDQLPG